MRKNRRYSQQVITEDQVVDTVKDHLLKRGWTIRSSAHAHQRGDDIVAESNGITMRVEAKGAGSSKESSKRFGQEFDSGQVMTHVAVAAMRAMAWVPEADTTAALAFPENPHHRRWVQQILPALQILDIGIFWISDSLQVRLEAPWQLE